MTRDRRHPLEGIPRAAVDEELAVRLDRVIELLDEIAVGLVPKRRPAAPPGTVRLREPRRRS